MGWCFYGNNQRGAPFSDITTYGPSQLAPPYKLYFVDVPHGKLFGSVQEGVLLTDDRGLPHWILEGPTYYGGSINVTATLIGEFTVHAEALREFHIHMELITR